MGSHESAWVIPPFSLISFVQTARVFHISFCTNARAATGLKYTPLKTTNNQSLFFTLARTFPARRSPTDQRPAPSLSLMIDLGADLASWGRFDTRTSTPMPHGEVNTSNLFAWILAHTVGVPIAIGSCAILLQLRVQTQCLMVVQERRKQVWSVWAVFGRS
jgi:hypothetical protein